MLRNVQFILSAACMSLERPGIYAWKISLSLLGLGLIKLLLKAASCLYSKKRSDEVENRVWKYVFSVLECK